MIERPIIAQYGDSDTDMLVYFNYQSGYIAFIYSFMNQEISQTYHSAAGSSYVKAISRFSQNGMAVFGKSDNIVTYLTVYRFYFLDSDRTTEVLSGTASFETAINIAYDQNDTVLAETDYSGDMSSIFDGSISQSTPTTYFEESQTAHDIVYTGGRNPRIYASHNTTTNISYDFY